MMPMKKEGADIPTILENIAEVSNQVFCFTAAITPKGMPISMAINMADIASINVPGNACIKIFQTGLFV